MAKDIAGKDEINLDNIEIDVVIIGRNVGNKLTQAAQFLTRRGWPTTVFTSVSKALEYIGQVRPDFVLVSLSHPSPAIQKIPDLIAGTFNLPCVGFVETMDNPSSSKLNRIKMRYKVWGKPSGLNFHRYLRKILHERLHAQENEDARKKKKSFMIKGEGGSLKKNSNMTTSRRRLKDFPEFQSAQTPVPGADVMDQLKRSLFGDSGEEVEMVEIDEVHAPEDDQPPETEHSAERDSIRHQLMENVVQSALSEICVPSTTSPKPILMVDRIGVFPVDSETLPGYLVMVWPSQAPANHEPFFNLAQITLQTAFMKMGVPAALQSGFFLPLPPVDFAQWVDDKAVFQFSAVHENHEIGMAFFSTSKPLPKVRPTGDKNMCIVSLETIATNQPVNFKAYLHLKKNQKYFLYLRNGRQLQDEQKERLKGHNVTDMFVKNVDVENLRIFLAATYLRDSIKGGSGDEGAA